MIVDSQKTHQDYNILLIDEDNEWSVSLVTPTGKVKFEMYSQFFAEGLFAELIDEPFTGVEVMPTHTNP